MSETRKLTNDLLKEKMTDAMVTRTGVLDANLILTNGIYENIGSMKNMPSNAYAYGILSVMGSKNFIEQQYYPHVKRNCFGFYRRMYYAGTWNNWVGIPYQALT